MTYPCHVRLYYGIPVDFSRINNAGIIQQNQIGFIYYWYSHVYHLYVCMSTVNTYVSSNRTERNREERHKTSHTTFQPNATYLLFNYLHKIDVKRMIVSAVRMHFSILFGFPTKFLYNSAITKSAATLVYIHYLSIFG